MFKFCRLDLLGKRQRQDTDAMWYTCLRAVEIRGWDEQPNNKNYLRKKAVKSQDLQ
jgi:hypothetical protein